MDVPYSQYDYVVLDACIFTKKFPDSLYGYLQNHEVLVADTFFSELAGYEVVLPAHQMEIFESNKRLVLPAIKQSAPFGPEHYIRLGLSRDITGMIRLLESGSARNPMKPHACLAVTSDRTLLEHIVLFDMPVDVHYLLTDEYITDQNRKELKERLEERLAEQQKKRGSLETLPNAREITVYRADGTALSLKRQRGTSSACIYLTLDEKYCAKIFREERWIQGKLDHIKELIRLNHYLKLDWALLPTELLYADADTARPVGYLMLRAGNPADIAMSCLLVLQRDQWEVYEDSRYRNYLELARMLTRQVLYLKVYNICPSDYNPGNFALMLQPEKTESAVIWQCQKLYMWDTDSFCMSGYVSDRWHGELVPQKKFCRSTEELCARALYLFVFYVLTLGEVPYLVDELDEQSVSGGEVFQFHVYSGIERRQFFYIPENLRKLFHQVLECGYEPSIPCLLHELEQACSGPAAEKTLAELDAEADQLVTSMVAFSSVERPRPCVQPAYPPLPEVSAPLSCWSQYTVPFAAKRCKRRPSWKGKTVE